MDVHTRCESSSGARRSTCKTQPGINTHQGCPCGTWVLIRDVHRECGHTSQNWAPTGIASSAEFNAVSLRRLYLGATICQDHTSPKTFARSSNLDTNSSTVSALVTIYLGHRTMVKHGAACTGGSYMRDTLLWNGIHLGSVRWRSAVKVALGEQHLVWFEPLGHRTIYAEMKTLSTDIPDGDCTTMRYRTFRFSPKGTLWVCSRSPPVTPVGSRSSSRGRRHDIVGIERASPSANRSR